MSAGGGYPPPADAAALFTSISLARRLDVMSIGKWANFLPVGKDFTIPARNFLPVGKGLQGSPVKVTKRHDGWGPRTPLWYGRYTSLPVFRVVSGLSANWVKAAWVRSCVGPNGVRPGLKPVQPVVGPNGIRPRPSAARPYTPCSGGAVKGPEPRRFLPFPVTRHLSLVTFHCLR
jgi:hypothetical protein